MVAFRDLWLGHPINQSVMTPCIAAAEVKNLEGKLIAPGYPVYANQCAIRMGIALRRAGAAPASFPGVTTCGVHPVGDMHYINANQLANALVRAKLPGVGPVERLSGPDPAAYYDKLFGRKGLIYIQDYWQRTSDRPGRPTGDHIDVWNGYRSSAKWLMEWFSWLGYTGNYAEAGEIWFWEVR